MRNGLLESSLTEKPA